MLYWNIYESAEARFVSKHITNKYDVVELGSSIGAIGTLAGKIKGDKKLICVEVNPDLTDIIKKNLILNGVNNYRVCNVGIGNSNSCLWFNEGANNTTSYLSTGRESGSKKIETLKLSNILQKESVGKYQLICDIEGSEIDILLNDPQSLENCELMIIEAHKVQRNNVTYTAEDIKKMIEKLNFSLIDQYSVNFVFTKNYEIPN